MNVSCAICEITQLPFEETLSIKHLSDMSKTILIEDLYYLALGLFSTKLITRHT